MTCGQCAAARKRRERMAQEAIAAKSNTVGSTPIVYSQKKKIERVEVNSVCGHLYDELLMLHRKCADLYKRVRFDGTGEEYHWLQVQREIGAWKDRLNGECPDEDQLNIYRTLINGEWIKFFQNQ